MTEQENPETPVAVPEPSAADMRFELFSERALPRIFRTLLIVSVVLVAPIFRIYGWIGAIGFIAGAAISYLNLRVLERSVEALADRIANRQEGEKTKERGRRIVLRFLLRYALVGGVAYAIFNGSVLAFRGFLWGLCVPVAAMMIEAGYEAYRAFCK